MAIKMLSNETEFNNFINQSEATLVDFYADWCGPCKMLKPILQQVSEEVGSYQIGELNVDNVQSIAEQYSIASIPTLIIYSNGREVKRHMGYLTADQLKTWLA